MIDIKSQIIKIVNEVLNEIYIEKGLIKDEDLVLSLIEESSLHVSSDYSIACFKLAKDLKENPVKIAEEVNRRLNIKIDELKEKNEECIIEKSENLSGYVNLWIKKEIYIKEVLDSLDKEGMFIGKGEKKKEKVLVEYSSPNIAKEFHIGHLKTTLIGEMLYRLYKYSGDDVVAINHLGDYGTQFGKLIEGYLRWKDEYSFKENALEDLNNIYVRISNLCKEDEEVMEKCRDNFKKLEDGNPEYVKIWKEFVNLSLEEFFKVYDMLNVSFDEIKGEASYSEDMVKVVEMLDEKGILKDSKGAKIIDFNDDKLKEVLIVKSNGSTLYITRDIAAALYRMKKYDYDKSLYVVASEQILHFQQLKGILRLMGIDKKYVDGLIHVPYGMIRLESGKMSTREGNVIKVRNLLEEAVNRTKKILDEKDNLNEEEKEEVAKKVGIGAIIFANLNTQLIKDEVFAWDNVLNFQGGSPYIQYICVRINSILKSAGYIREVNKTKENFLGKDKNLFVNYVDNIEEIAGKREDIDINIYSEKALEIFKKLHEFKEKIKEAREKREPYILANYALDLSKMFSEYYTNEKILVEDKKEQNAKIHLIYAVLQVLTIILNIFGIEIPDKM